MEQSLSRNDLSDYNSDDEFIHLQNNQPPDPTTILFSNGDFSSETNTEARQTSNNNNINNNNINNINYLNPKLQFHWTKSNAEVHTPDIQSSCSSFDATNRDKDKDRDKMERPPSFRGREVGGIPPSSNSFRCSVDSTLDPGRRHRKASERKYTARDCVRLSYYLRHGAQQAGLEVRRDGFIRVSDLLKMDDLKHLSLEDISAIVNENVKKRYSMAYLCKVPQEGRYAITPSSSFGAQSDRVNHSSPSGRGGGGRSCIGRYEHQIRNTKSEGTPILISSSVDEYPLLETSQCERKTNESSQSESSKKEKVKETRSGSNYYKEDFGSQSNLDSDDESKNINNKNYFKNKNNNYKDSDVPPGLSWTNSGKLSNEDYNGSTSVPHDLSSSTSPSSSATDNNNKNNIINNNNKNNNIDINIQSDSLKIQTRSLDSIETHCDKIRNSKIHSEESMMVLIPFNSEQQNELNGSIYLNNLSNPFFLESIRNKLFIRAHQGHSMPCVDPRLICQPVVSASQIPVCVHGTFWESWNSILEIGLHRMHRLQIHFAKGLPGDHGVVSGLRRNSEVAIFINVESAIKDGMQFYVSGNGVVLTDGIDGIVDPKYFLSAVSLPDRKPIPLQPRRPGHRPTVKKNNHIIQNNNKKNNNIIINDKNNNNNNSPYDLKSDSQNENENLSGRIYSDGCVSLTRHKGRSIS